LSSDWDKYSTPEETRDRLNYHKKANGSFKKAEDYFVVEFLVEDLVTKLPDQEIEHDPIYGNDDLPDNRSHAKITGDKNVEVRLKMVDLCEWVIHPDS
jgi:hypothetical protein